MFWYVEGDTVVDSHHDAYPVMLQPSALEFFVDENLSLEHHKGLGALGVSVDCFC